MILLSRLRLITFDVTDTLLKFRLTPGQQYGEIGAMYGLNCDGNVLSKSFEKEWKKMNLKHPNFGRCTGIGWEKWWKIIVTETFRNSKIIVEDKKIEDIAFHLIELYKISSSWKLCNGVNELLSYIRHKGVPMGVISNFDPRLDTALTNVKLRHYFKFVITSYEAGFEKPNPNIFRTAMLDSKIKNLKPEECLHVGDQIWLDYDGAKNSGWQAVLINDKDSNTLKDQYPDIDTNSVFKNLFGLHQYFIETSNENLFL